MLGMVLQKPSQDSVLGRSPKTASLSCKIRASFPPVWTFILLETLEGAVPATPCRDSGKSSRKVKGNCRLENCF